MHSAHMKFNIIIAIVMWIYTSKEIKTFVFEIRHSYIRIIKFNWIKYWTRKIPFFVVVIVIFPLAKSTRHKKTQKKSRLWFLIYNVLKSQWICSSILARAFFCTSKEEKKNRRPAASISCSRKRIQKKLKALAIVRWKRKKKISKRFYRLYICTLYSKQEYFSRI